MTSRNSDGSTTTLMERARIAKTRWDALSPWYTLFIIGLAIFTMLALQSCCLVSVPESVRTGMVTIQYPPGDFDDGAREKGFMGLPPPPDCQRYAHDAAKPDHNKWADCMGVGYK